VPTLYNQELAFKSLEKNLNILIFKKNQTYGQDDTDQHFNMLYKNNYLLKILCTYKIINMNYVQKRLTNKSIYCQ